MARFLHPIRSRIAVRGHSWILLCIWGLGFWLGSQYFFPELPGLVTAAAAAAPSFLGLVCCGLLPLLISGFAVYVGAPPILWGVCFCKAFLFGAVFQAVSAAFGSAGWLIRWLLLFSDNLSVAVVLFYCLHHIPGSYGFSPRRFAACCCVLILVFSVDYHVISPFLRRILL